MGQLISLKRRSCLKQTPIVVNLGLTDEEELGMPVENQTDIKQTRVYGIMCPILSVNNRVIQMSDIIDYRLDFRQRIPELEFWVRDRGELISRYLAPGGDNEVRTQILPVSDEHYRKIDLTFFIAEYEAEQQGVIHCACIYKLFGFTNSRFLSLGLKSTYELCDYISTETGLGFASNLERTQDQRFIYFPHKNFEDTLNSEIELSQAGADCVLDYWIDQWNNLNLVNIYERLNSMDSEDELSIWINQATEAQSKNANEQEEVLAIPEISNLPSLKGTELYMIALEQKVSTASYKTSGNNLVLSIYEENRKEYLDHTITDGDIKFDTSTVYEYYGEVFGDYNYLIARACREMYLRKLSTENLILTGTSPSLGLMRGRQVRLVWYNSGMDSSYQGQLDKVLGQAQSSEGWLNEYNKEEYHEDGAMFQLNMGLSGQYMVNGISYEYRGNQWQILYELVRPASRKPEPLAEYNEKMRNAEVE